MKINKYLQVPQYNNKIRKNMENNSHHNQNPHHPKKTTAVTNQYKALYKMSKEKRTKVQLQDSQGK